MNEMSTVNAREVPIKLRNKFKAWCARRGFSMQDAFVALIEYGLENKINLKPRIDKIVKEREKRKERELRNAESN